MINVFVVAPNPALRAGLKAMLGSDEQVAVIGEAASLTASEQIPEETDVYLAALPGSAAELNAVVPVDPPASGPFPAVLYIGDDPQAAGMLASLSLRAWGVLSLEASAGELSAAVHALNEGLVTGAPSLIKPALASLRTLAGREDGDAPEEELTRREVEVLQLLTQGLPNKQIAAALEISEHTVKFHVSSIYAKLGVVNRTEAVRMGARRGLIVL